MKFDVTSYVGDVTHYAKTQSDRSSEKSLANRENSQSFNFFVVICTFPENKPQNQFFYSKRNARIASAVLATAIQSVRPSVCLSVRPSVRHTPVLCQNDGT